MRTYLIITWSVFQKLFVWQVVFLWNNGIRSRVKRWKFAFSSVVLNASSAADGDEPVAISTPIS